MSWLQNIRTLPSRIIGQILESPDGDFSAEIDDLPNATPPYSSFLDGAFGGNHSAARLGDLSNGLGVPGSDPFYSQFWAKGTLTSSAEDEIAGLMRDAIARKIVGVPWADAIRPWFDIRGMPSNTQDLVQHHLERLHAKEELWKLNFMGDAWGDAIIVVGVDDPSVLKPATLEDERLHFETPLSKESLRGNRNILWLRTFGKGSSGGDSGFTRAYPAGIHTARFGEPTIYRVHNFWAPARSGYCDLNSTYSGQVNVHYTRTIQATTPNAESVFVGLDPYLKAYHGALASAGQLLRTSSISFIKVARWRNQTRNNRAESHARLALAALSMSTLGSIFLDKDDEDHEFQARNLTGVSDLILKAQESLAAAARQPMSVIFGLDSKGFASAEEVTNRYFAEVVNRQTSRLTDQATALVRLILNAYVPLGERPEEGSWYVDWRPPRTFSEMEKAKIRKGTFEALLLENRAIAAGVGIPGAITSAEIRSTQGANHFTVDPVLEPSNALLFQTSTDPSMSVKNIAEPPSPSEEVETVEEGSKDVQEDSQEGEG